MRENKQKGKGWPGKTPGIELYECNGLGGAMML